METKEKMSEKQQNAERSVGKFFAAGVRAVENFRRNNVVGKINRFLNSKYMLFVFAALTLLSNICELEIVVYCLVFLIALYTVFCGKDMLILAPIAVFMYLTPSAENNPFIHSDSFFFPGKGPALWLVVALIVVFLIFFFLRVGTDFGFARFFRGKRKLLSGFLLLGAAFLSGGIGYEKYDWRNIYYSLLLFLALFLLYFILTAAVRWEDVPKDYFAWLGLTVGFTVVIQLINVFIIHSDNIFGGEPGVIVRNYIYTGWGTYTSMSVVMLICMPCAFYLAAVKKHGYVFNILGNALYLAIFASNGRGSVLMGAVIYVLCAIGVLARKKNRRGNLIVYAVVLALAVAVLIVLREKVGKILESVLALGDSNRINLFKDGLSRFRLFPLFGEGFYACPTDDWNNLGGAAFIPAFWHNTLIQMLAACGLIGLAAYLFHRLQTLLLFFRQPELSKTFIGFSVLGILLTCLLDCHIFNIGVTLIYSAALAFAEKTGEMKRESEDDLLLNLIRNIRRKKVSAVEDTGSANV